MGKISIKNRRDCPVKQQSSLEKVSQEMETTSKINEIRIMMIIIIKILLY